MVTAEEIRSAAERIRPHVHRTPILFSRSLSAMTGCEVYLKAENLQKTGSFKVRGAFNKLSRLGADRVIAASMGNHAQAIAYAAWILGIKARIVMPVTAPLIKEEATRGYGAEVVLHGDTFSAALSYARSERDYTFIHAFDDPDIIAGQGTIALEVFEDLPDADVILVPVGGGGLIGGIAVAATSCSPKTEVTGVQAEAAISAVRSLKEGRIVAHGPGPTIADGIAVGKVGDIPFEIMKRHVTDILSVGDEDIAVAILLFLERKKLVVEGAGAVPLAALLRWGQRFSDRRVVLVLSGGNIDFTLIDHIVHKGLVGTGRAGVFEVTLDDVPGSLHALTGVITRHRGNILHVFHDRFPLDIPVGKARVVVAVEARGKEHFDAILSELSARGMEVRRR
jgi:threonine dehydratase